MGAEGVYQQIEPIEDLKDLVHSFWTHYNVTSEPETLSIFPDSFFKIVFLAREGQVLDYFVTGLWAKTKEFTIPANTSSFGCRLMILAPEYLLARKVDSIFGSSEKLPYSYLNLRDFDLRDFETIVKRWQEELIRLKPKRSIEPKKKRLSELLYEMKGEISANEVSRQVFWSNRQINRYLNDRLGISLKTYLDMQKVYEAYLQIRKGILFPEKAFFDQSHFIRTIKKYTGETPSGLLKQIDDRFIQLKNIREK